MWHFHLKLFPEDLENIATLMFSSFLILSLFLCSFLPFFLFFILSFCLSFSLSFFLSFFLVAFLSAPTLPFSFAIFAIDSFYLYLSCSLLPFCLPSRFFISPKYLNCQFGPIPSSETSFLKLNVIFFLWRRCQK